MFQKFIKKKAPEEPKKTIDLNLLGEHLDSVKVSLLEIRGFRKKKVTKSPTYHFTLNIDIEEAWPSYRETFFQAYDLLCELAKNLEVEYEEMQTPTSFGKAIDQFANLIDRMTIFIEMTDALQFSEASLQNIDSTVLRVQQYVILLQKNVMVDFVFTRGSKN